MKADNLDIAKVFSNGGSIFYVLPHFQREYTWGRPEWDTLLNDALAVYDEYREDKPPEHFLGSLVVIDGGRTQGVIPVNVLVDGQQRLITISLLLCALRDMVRPKLPDLARLIDTMLINQGNTGDAHFKIFPTTKYGDRAAYQAIVNGESVEKAESSIPSAYHYIVREIRSVLNGALDPQRFCFVLLNCFQVVFINLSRSENPYRIFESLNAKGKPLTQADLVRNYIAMKVPQQRQEELFSKIWVEIEQRLQEKRTVARRLGEMSAFLRHYLALQTSVLCNEDHIYARFRDRMERDFQEADAFIDEIARLRRFAVYYDTFLQPEKEARSEIRERLERLKVLETSTAYPFMLALAEMNDQRTLSDGEYAHALALLENYSLRRYLCGEQTNYTNRMYPALMGEIDREQGDDEPLSMALARVLAAKRYPSDRKVEGSIRSDQINRSGSQNKERICMILDAINRRLTQEDVNVTLSTAPTIEHIMPQTLTDEWKHELGYNSEAIHHDYLDTLGNLTIVTQSWNSSMSNGSFAEKRKKLAGSGLAINSRYFSEHADRWDESSICARADFLTQHICEIWPQFHEPSAAPEQHVRVSPRQMILQGESFDVKTWGNVMIHIAERAIAIGKIEQVRQAAPLDFSATGPSRKTRQLSNGWCINTWKSAHEAKIFCRRAMAAMGYAPSDWQVVEESSPINSSRESFATRH